MRRIAHWLLNALTILSLLLCVATAVLWVRGRSTADVVAWCGDSADRREASTISLRSGYGGLQWEEYRLRFKGPPPDAEFLRWLDERRGWDWLHPVGRQLPAWTLPKLAKYDDILTGPYEWPEFQLHSPRWNWIARREEDQRYVNRWRGCVVPYWAAGIATLILPASRSLGWLGRWRRARRDGLCGSCAYDLTGNVSGVCPEMFSPL